MFLTLSFPLLLAALPLSPLSTPELEQVGKRVWQNEAAGRIEGLTAWNSGEAFASLGIGHFIWYPAGPKGPFEESFPSLLKFLQKQGVSLPKWLENAPSCPWQTRESFEADFHSAKMRELRQLLSSSIPQQSLFLSNRLDSALPRMLEQIESSRRQRVEQNYRTLASSSSGRFALIDYVNFKGEGTKETERYKGAGWGLLQVLEAMPSGGDSKAFGKTAAEVLKLRVKNAPPERREERWLPGWLNRVNSY